MDRVTHTMRREKWKEIIRACNESGMKKKDWLEANHINPKTFYRWQRKLRMEIGTDLILAQKAAAENTAGNPQFSLIEPSSEKPVILIPQAVIRNNHLCIEISEGITDDLLIRIMKAASHV